MTLRTDVMGFGTGEEPKKQQFSREKKKADFWAHVQAIQLFEKSWASNGFILFLNEHQELGASFGGSVVIFGGSERILRAFKVAEVPQINRSTSLFLLTFSCDPTF